MGEKCVRSVREECEGGLGECEGVWGSMRECGSRVV